MTSCIYLERNIYLPFVRVTCCNTDADVETRGRRSCVLLPPFYHMLCRNYVCNRMNCALGLNATKCNWGQDLHVILPGPLGSRSFGCLPQQTPCLIHRQGQTYTKHLVALELEIQTTKYHNDSFEKADLSLLCQE